MPKLPEATRLQTTSPATTDVRGIARSTASRLRGVELAGAVVGGALERASQHASEQQSAHDQIRLGLVSRAINASFAQHTADSQKAVDISAPGFLSRYSAELQEILDGHLNGPGMNGVSVQGAEQIRGVGTATLANAEAEMFAFQAGETKRLTFLELEQGRQQNNALISQNPTEEHLLDVLGSSLAQLNGARRVMTESEFQGQQQAVAASHFAAAIIAAAEQGNAALANAHLDMAEAEGIFDEETRQTLGQQVAAIRNKHIDAAWLSLNERVIRGEGDVDALHDEATLIHENAGGQVTDASKLTTMRAIESLRKGRTKGLTDAFLTQQARDEGGVRVGNSAQYDAVSRTFVGKLAELGVSDIRDVRYTDLLREYTDTYGVFPKDATGQLRSALNGNAQFQVAAARTIVDLRDRGEIGGPLTKGRRNFVTFTGHKEMFLKARALTAWMDSGMTSQDAVDRWDLENKQDQATKDRLTAREAQYNEYVTENFKQIDRASVREEVGLRIETGGLLEDAVITEPGIFGAAADFLFADNPRNFMTEEDLARSAFFPPEVEVRYQIDLRDGFLATGIEEQAVQYANDRLQLYAFTDSRTDDNHRWQSAAPARMWGGTSEADQRIYDRIAEQRVELISGLRLPVGTEFHLQPTTSFGAAEQLRGRVDENGQPLPAYIWYYKRPEEQAWNVVSTTTTDSLGNEVSNPALWTPETPAEIAFGGVERAQAQIAAIEKSPMAVAYRAEVERGVAPAVAAYRILQNQTANPEAPQ